MGLNVNYNLLIEGNNIYHKIPEYKKTYNPVIFAEEFMIQRLSEFNQEIRESRDMLASLCCDDSTVIYEGSIIVNISERLRSIWKKIKDAVRAVWGWIKSAFEKLITKIKEKAASIKDNIENKYRYHERITLLKKALADADKEEKTLYISDINPTTDLLDKNFPDVSVIGGSLSKMATDTMNDYCINMVQKSSASELIDDTELKASESFVNFIENEKEGMLAKIFGKYSYDTTNVIQSSKDAAVKAFGSSERKDTVITMDLYALACDNLEKDQVNSITHSIDALYSNATKNYDSIMRELDTIEKSISYFDKISSNNFDIDMKEKYHNVVKTVSSRISRAANVIQTVINANYNILFHKVIRVQQLFEFGGDSYKVKKACHHLIAKYINIDEPEIKAEAKNEAFVGRDHTDRIYDMQNDFDNAVVMVNEALLESSYTDQLLIAIHEANENPQQDNNQSQQQSQQQPAQQQQDGQNQNQQQQNAGDKSKFSIMEFVKNIIAKFGEAMKKFSNRINELIAKNGPDHIFWNNNAEKIKKLNLADTKANEWYKYNIDSFKNSTYVKFDINDQALKDDASFQDAIMKKISPTLPNFNENDTFSQKINKIYQGEYVNDSNGQGQTLQQIGYRHDIACKYVEEFITRGFGSEFLGGVSNDYSKIDGDYKEVTRNYQNLASQMKTTNADNAQDQPAGNGQGGNSQPAQTQQKPQGQNNAAIDEEDFRFNLAEHFGLVQREASFTVGQTTSQSIAAVGGNENQTAVQNKELDAMIKRCFNYNTIAVTAKMTAIVAAYKQYIQLFKYVIKPGNNNTNNNNQNQQQQNAGENNNQQQNQAQQQGQQQNQK